MKLTGIQGLVILGIVVLSPVFWISLLRPLAEDETAPYKIDDKHSLVQCKFLQPDVPYVISKRINSPPRPDSFPRTCKAVVAELLELKQPTEAPPQKIPEQLYDQYTLNRTIPVTLSYQYQKYAGATAQTPVWTMEQINENRAKARDKVGFGNYPHDVHFIYAMLEKWGLDAVWGRKGIVVGSENPWLEAILLEWGASRIITIEYGKISSLHPQVGTMLPSQSYKMILEDAWEPVDWAFSFSSIEHSGLGRYGDPINPFGDFEAMEQISCLVKPGGILFLGFPVAADHLVFNLHRIYGPKRLERIFEGWRFLDMHGVGDPDFEMNGSFASQPVIVLQNYRGCAP